MELTWGCGGNKAGAIDYLVKPWFIWIKNSFWTIIREDEIKNENQYFREEEDKRYNFKEIVGQSTAMKKVLDMLKKVAPLPTTVLITGESGTGK